MVMTIPHTTCLHIKDDLQLTEFSLFNGNRSQNICSILTSSTHSIFSINIKEITHSKHSECRKGEHAFTHTVLYYVAIN